MDLCDSFDQPETEPTNGSYEEKAVATLLEPNANACEAKRNPPSLDGEQALIKSRDYVDDL